MYFSCPAMTKECGNSQSFWRVTDSQSKPKAVSIQFKVGK